MCLKISGFDCFLNYVFLTLLCCSISFKPNEQYAMLYIQAYIHLEHINKLKVERWYELIFWYDGYACHYCSKTKPHKNGHPNAKVEI